MQSRAIECPHGNSDEENAAAEWGVPLISLKKKANRVNDFAAFLV
jgi:hypothetical protein